MTKPNLNPFWQTGTSCPTTTFRRRRARCCASRKNFPGEVLDVYRWVCDAYPSAHFSLEPLSPFDIFHYSAYRSWRRRKRKAQELKREWLDTPL
ncbi:hypothetical protein BDZ94DRAFT_1256404 [Collybia nuda]|uniref:Uncharacterized protein n=1 Tax=Collybia nuda TaxID=64659 RepID=A0A9P6CL56_9AGAR|nr:hypothetical protein BDZ94DRAFT_1256404 [Collybia nuda]